MTAILRLFLADDHALVRTGIRALLAQQPDFEIVGEAADGQAVLSGVAQTAPDVVLLDISLPGLNGLEMIPRLKQSFPGLGIVILSMHNVEEYVLRAYQQGALSYLTKDAPAEELTAAIRAAGRLEVYYPAGMSQERLRAYLRAAGSQPASRLGRLTARERETLQLIAEGHATLAIANKMGISPKTVETHRAHLCEKLELYDTASLTRFAVYCGLASPE
jgi:DNA-binding NarL/FixJ family response regulator